MKKLFLTLIALNLSYTSNIQSMVENTQHPEQIQHEHDTLSQKYQIEQNQLKAQHQQENDHANKI